MPNHTIRGDAASRSPETTSTTHRDKGPAAMPAPWVTHLTCPACHTPDALLAFDGVGTVCRECGETT
jgi:hypothetical protein